MDAFITHTLKKKNMNTYIPYIVGAFITHMSNKKQMWMFYNVVIEDPKHTRD